MRSLKKVDVNLSEVALVIADVNNLGVFGENFIKLLPKKMIVVNFFKYNRLDLDDYFDSWLKGVSKFIKFNEAKYPERPIKLLGVLINHDFLKNVERLRSELYYLSTKKWLDLKAVRM